MLLNVNVNVNVNVTSSNDYNMVYGLKRVRLTWSPIVVYLWLSL